MKFIFTSKHLHNSTVSSAGEKPTLRFTVSTDDVDKKRRTTIWNGEKESIAAVIHWKDEIFEIQGRKLSFTTVAIPPPGFWVSDKSKIIRWDGDAYLVKFRESERWEAKSELEEKLAATLTPYRSRLFHDDELATFVVEPHAERETLFFLVLFVYSEYKRVAEGNEDGYSVPAVPVYIDSS